MGGKTQFSELQEARHARPRRRTVFVVVGRLAEQSRHLPSQGLSLTLKLSLAAI